MNSRHALGWVGLVIVVVGTWWLYAAASPDYPADDSAEAGFARDMSVHHAQAVEMAHLISRRAGDEKLRQVATDIVLTQQGQIGIMSGWLDTWGLPHTGRAEAMAWMGMPTSGPMPGMASAEEIGSLRTLPAPDAEILFLQLMIRHHQGGVAMADAAAKMATRPEVVRLAKSMVAAQSYETRVMTDMLRARKAAPDAPLQMGATMPGHAHTPPSGIDRVLRTVPPLMPAALVILGALFMVMVATQP